LHGRSFSAQSGMSLAVDSNVGKQNSTVIYFCPDRRCVERIVPKTESDLVECRFCGACWRIDDLILQDDNETPCSATGGRSLMFRHELWTSFSSGCGLNVLDQWAQLIRHIPKRRSMFVRVDGFSALHCFWDAILLESYLLFHLKIIFILIKNSRKCIKDCFLERHSSPDDQIFALSGSPTPCELVSSRPKLSRLRYSIKPTSLNIPG